MHRLDLEFEITFTGRWHVGSGTGKGLIDNAVRMKRIWNNGKSSFVPMIPGSTLKGILRQTCEEIAELFSLKWLDPQDETGILHHGFLPLAESKYIVDRLFGTRYQGECLYVEDGQWVNKDGLDFDPAYFQGIIQRNSISRATKTSQQNQLFSHNYIRNGVFACQIEAIHQEQDLTAPDEDLLPFEYILLLAGVSGLSRLGTSRSVGLGQLKTKITAVHYNGKDFLDSWMHSLELLELAGGDW